MVEIHRVLETIQGVHPVGSWVEDDHHSSVSICIEIYEGAPMGYFAGLDESGVSVRVDLDALGWRRLAEVASDVAARLETPDATN